MIEALRLELEETRRELDRARRELDGIKLNEQRKADLLDEWQRLAIESAKEEERLEAKLAAKERELEEASKDRTEVKVWGHRHRERADAIQRDLDAALALLNTVPSKIGFAESMIDRMNPQRDKFSAWGDDFIRRLGALKTRPATAAGEEAKGQREEPVKPSPAEKEDIARHMIAESEKAWEEHEKTGKVPDVRIKGCKVDGRKVPDVPAPENPWRALCMEVELMAGDGYPHDIGGAPAVVPWRWFARRTALEAAEEKQA